MTSPSPSDTDSERPRVAIVFWETYLGCAPSIINAARALDERGYAVDILIRHDQHRFADPPHLGRHVRVITVDAPTSESHRDRHTGSDDADQGRRWARRLFTQQQRRLLAGFLSSCRQRLSSWRPSTIFARERFARHALDVALQNQYVCIIGVDTIGLVTAHQIALRLGVNVIYWSLEIMFETDFTDRIGRRWKREEKECHQRSLALVIQDRERAAALNQQNNADACPVILVPNSPRGFPSADVQRDFFHRMFDLSADCCIILHAGSVCEGMRSHELAAAAATWPDELRLIFQSHTHLGRHDQYAQALPQIGKGRVLLSAAPVSYDELDNLYCSARIGLVIYDTTLGPNFTLMAGASGKLAHCLRCGVPVISIDNESIGRVLTGFGCGIAVDSPGEIESAIQRILADYESYRTSALDCYRTAYEFDKHFAAVLQRIEAELRLQRSNTSRAAGMTP